MSAFEAVMLICFGAAWLVSIYKSYESKTNDGKSVLFLLVVAIGYLAGITHKLIYNFDLVIYLYIANAIMVFTDIALYYRNKSLACELD